MNVAQYMTGQDMEAALLAGAKRLRHAKRQRGAGIPGHHQHRAVACWRAYCRRCCIALGLPADSASGTRRHLLEAIASLHPTRQES